MKKLIPLALVSTALICAARAQTADTIGGGSTENLSTDLAHAFQSGSAYSLSLAYGHVSSPAEKGKWAPWLLTTYTPKLTTIKPGLTYGWNSWVGTSLDDSSTSGLGIGVTAYWKFSSSGSAFLGAEVGQATSTTSKLSGVAIITAGFKFDFGS